jgi:hypothetical protein
MCIGFLIQLPLHNESGYLVDTTTATTTVTELTLALTILLVKSKDEAGIYQRSE